MGISLCAEAGRPRTSAPDSGSEVIRVETFAASFEQHSEGADPALFGAFTYDARTTVVPSPGTFALILVGLLPLLRPARHRRKIQKGRPSWAGPIAGSVTQRLLAEARADPRQIEPIEAEGGESLALGPEVVA